MLKQVAQIFKQILLTTTGNLDSNLDSSKIQYDNTLNTVDRQSAPTLNTSNIQKQTITSPKDPYKSDSSEHIHMNVIANFEKNYYGHRALSHSLNVHNKILQELNLNGLCQYSNSYKAYILEKSNHIVTCTYVLVFLRQSTYYVITPHTHTSGTKSIQMKYLRV